MVLTLVNERNEFLFASTTTDGKTYYALTDRQGNIIRIGELNVKLDAFLSVVSRAGYKNVDF